MRYPLGTKYGEIVASVRRLLSREPFRRRMRYTRLLADKTGVLIATAGRYGVMFSGGSEETAQLMSLFYEGIHRGAEIPTALRDAQRQIVSRLSFFDPDQEPLRGNVHRFDATHRRDRTRCAQRDDTLTGLIWLVIDLDTISPLLATYVAALPSQGQPSSTVGNVRMQGAGRLLGSVANGITHRAPCDVLVVKTA